MLPVNYRCVRCMDATAAASANCDTIRHKQQRETLVCMKKTATRHKRGEGNRSEQTAVAPWMLLLQPQQVAQDQQRGAVCVCVSAKRRNALCKRACRSTGLHIRGQRYTGTVSGLYTVQTRTFTGQHTTLSSLRPPWSIPFGHGPPSHGGQSTHQR